eukprot:TRINITY_DN1919_c0_g2_i1.p1 TRINITY_DN1919_c0_g2~~TRINITY_DN1919_c0_g2_i1.p1  ORF type:complete len:505 (+),score=160.54 TRINITY_DN1919_c0_g2_i1:55-1515(+)
MDGGDGAAAPARLSGGPLGDAAAGQQPAEEGDDTEHLERVAAAAEARAAAAEQRAAAAERRAAAAEERAAAAVDKASWDVAAAQQHAADAENQARNRAASAEISAACAERHAAEALEAAADPPEPNTEPLFDTACVRAYSSFEEMQLPEPLLRGVYSCGLGKVPCAVQQRAVVPIAAGEDVLIQAPAGEDRTMAYAIGVLQRVLVAARELQIVVLTATDAEAARAEHVLSNVGEHMFDGPFCLLASSPQPCEPAVVVGTPASVLDAATKGLVSFKCLRAIVLDGVDDILPQCSSLDVSSLRRLWSWQVQTVTTASVVYPEVLRLVGRCTRGESRANVQVGVQQFYVAVEEEYKMETLRDLLALIPGRSAIVFCRNKRRAEWVAERLKDAACLDAGAPPADRERADAELRRGGVLVTTDVGLCEPQRVAAVFSFDIDDGRYLRRARHLRPDRAIAVAFVMPTEMDRLADHQQCCTVCELPKDFASIL